MRLIHFLYVFGNLIDWLWHLVVSLPPSLSLVNRVSDMINWFLLSSIDGTWWGQLDIVYHAPQSTQNGFYQFFGSARWGFGSKLSANYRFVLLIPEWRRVPKRRPKTESIIIKKEPNLVWTESDKSEQYQYQLFFRQKNTECSSWPDKRYLIRSSRSKVPLPARKNVGTNHCPSFFGWSPKWGLPNIRNYLLPFFLINFLPTI